MKVFITVTEPDIEGYFNISPLKGHLLSDLSNMIDDNECLEILAPEMIDYIPINQMETIIGAWVKKLRHGGKIILGGKDIYEIAKRIVRGEFDTKVANLVMYGSQSGVWDISRGKINLKDLVDLLERFGLQITKKKLNGIDMLVEAQRP